MGTSRHWWNWHRCTSFASLFRVLDVVLPSTAPPKRTCDQNLTFSNALLQCHSYVVCLPPPCTYLSFRASSQSRSQLARTFVQIKAILRLALPISISHQPFKLSNESTWLLNLGLSSEKSLTFSSSQRLSACRTHTHTLSPLPPIRGSSLKCSIGISAAARQYAGLFQPEDDIPSFRSHPRRAPLVG